MYTRFYDRNPIQPKRLYDLKFKEQHKNNTENCRGEHLYDITLAFL